MVSYHLRILAIAKELGKPLAFRRGGGASFGVVMPASEDDTHLFSWALAGAPSSWGPVTLREWLEKQGWAVMDTTQPKRRNLPWSFRGRMAGQPNQRSFSYELVDFEGKKFYIHIKRWEKKRKVDEQAKPISGPRWWHKAANYDDPIEDDDQTTEITQTWPDQQGVNATTLDSTAEDADGDTEMQTVGGKHPGGPAGAGVSPPKKKVKQANGKEAKPDIDRIVGGAAGPEANGRRTTVIDTGGSGNCGWRSLAFAIAGLNNSALSDEAIVDKLDPLAKTLQVRVTTHLIQNKKHWADFWSPDEKTSTVMEDGEIPMTVDAYCEAVKRPNRWVDGLLLATAAILQKINIIVWTKRKGDWCKIAILKSGPEWKKSQSVPLILSRGHFMTLRHVKGQWPKEWVTEAGEETPCSQGIDTQLTDINPLLGRGGMLSTPINKIRKRPTLTEEEDLEALLQPCATSSTRKRSSVGDSLLKPCSSCKSITTSAKNKKQFCDTLLKSCSPCKSVASPGIQKKQLWKDESRKRIRRPNERIIVDGGSKQWKCPLCEVVLDITKGDTIDCKAVARHLRKAHPKEFEKDRIEIEKQGRARTSLGLRQLAWPVEFQKAKKEDDFHNAQFVCPFCDLVLPKFPEGMPDPQFRYLQMLSKKHHLKTCKKIVEPVTLRKYQTLFGRKHATAMKIKKLKEKGHDPVVIELKGARNKRVLGDWLLVCKKCRALMRMAYCKREKCSGKAFFKTSPGMAFWKAAGSPEAVDDIAKKLGMKQAEVAQLRATLDC